MGLVIRTVGDPAVFAATLRREVQALDKDQPVYNVRTMDDVVANSLGTRRVSMQLFAVFAGAALLLAAIGIYGVIAYTVVQRTREIGIRMALGAQKIDMLTMILRQSFAVIGIGLVAGILGALAVTRLMSSLLYGVSSSDLSIYAVVTIVLSGAGLVATYFPARRAMTVNPMVALRTE